MKKNSAEVELTEAERDYILSPRAIRERARQLFARTEKGEGYFAYHPEKLAPTVDYVVRVTRQNYPTLEIPFHSRWGHFRAGGIDRVKEVDARLQGLDPLERARRKFDLVIPSVLLDAGAGAAWKYAEAGKTFARSEGLGIASLRMFLTGALDDLAHVSRASLEKHFQVSAANPLVGVEGRLTLVRNLGAALPHPGALLDEILAAGRPVRATTILQAVLRRLGPIWPGRLSSHGVNLGDVWRHSGLQGARPVDSLVPFHKLSQWMTYSLIEPILEAGIAVEGVGELTGLAEYRNGGLMLDAGLITLRDPSLAQKEWSPDSDLILEWRALTVHLLDLIGEGVRQALGKTPEEFPLAKALEGGTWWAGRFLAQEKRAGGTPPLQIQSDGTVF